MDLYDFSPEKSQSLKFVFPHLRFSTYMFLQNVWQMNFRAESGEIFLAENLRQFVRVTLLAKPRYGYLAICISKDTRRHDWYSEKFLMPEKSGFCWWLWHFICSLCFFWVLFHYMNIFTDWWIYGVLSVLSLFRIKLLSREHLWTMFSWDRCYTGVERL